MKKSFFVFLLFVLSIGMIQPSLAQSNVRNLAEKGNADAQVRLGNSYSTGTYELKNYQLAVKWYRKSAVQGNPLGQYHLAIMYATGRGVLQSNTYAYMWANLAAYNGAEEGKRLMSRLEPKMDSMSIIKAQNMATRCLNSSYASCN